jgi:hypothetical protein
MADLTARINSLRAELEFIPPMRLSLLDDATFSNSDVEAACYVTPTQLHNWVSRGWIRLTAANPGRGRKRLYTGRDAIAVATAAALQPFGMMQVAEQLVRVNQIEGRALNLLTAPYLEPGFALAIVPSPEGDDWLYVPLSSESPEPVFPAPGFVVLEIDRLIVETLENLLLAKAGEPIPERPFPKKRTPTESEDEFLEFTGKAYRDEQGRRIYRGLTVEESAEYDRLINVNMLSRMSDTDIDMSDEESDRYLEYCDRNERARLEHIGMNMGSGNDDPP